MAAISEHKVFRLIQHAVLVVQYMVERYIGSKPQAALQGRDIRRRIFVLDAIALALQLTEDERSHCPPVHARAAAPARPSPSERAGPSRVQRLVQRIEFPAFVLGRRMDVLAFNSPAVALLGGSRERNALRNIFLDEGARTLYADQGAGRRRVRGLRPASAGEDPDDAQLVELNGRASSAAQRDLPALCGARQ